MMFESFMQAFSDMIGVTLANGSILFALLCSLILIMLPNLRREKEPFISIAMGLVSSIMWTVAGWYPIIVGAAMGMIFAMLMAWYVSNIAKGGG